METVADGKEAPDKALPQTLSIRHDAWSTDQQYRAFNKVNAAPAGQRKFGS